MRWIFFLLWSALVSGKGVKEVGSKAELDRILNYHELTGKPVVIDFYSTTCGPCRMIEPRYKAMAGEFKDTAVFLKVNVQTSDAAQGIRSMPTFRFYFRGKKVHEFSGADENQIRQTLKTYTNKAKNHNAMKIRDIENKSALKPLLQAALKMPVVVAFVTKTDENCVAIWPAMKAANTKYNGKVVFAKVNMEDNPDAAKLCKVDTPSTFHVYVSGKVVDSYTGADQDQLTNMVTRAADAHASTSASSSDDGEKPSKAKKEPEPKKIRKAKRPQRRSAARLRAASLHPEKVVIVGAGPGGLSAAIYAARAGLKPVVIAPDFGGQLTYTKEVENYPGALDASGESLLESLRIQAESFDTQFEATTLLQIDLSSRPFKLTTNQTDLSEGLNIITAHTVIIATGADSIWLGCAGEETYRAKGVSTCATCDGYLYKGKPVVIVGGGDSAMEEALFMARIASSVTLVHRRDEFKASYILQQRVKNHMQIKIKYHSVVKEFKGTEGGLTTVVIQNTQTSEEEEITADAAFVAIGHTPNTGLFEHQLGMDQTGYLITKPGRTQTTVEGVFACGDVADSHYRQAVTSAATGAMAAMDAEHYLDEQGIDVGDGSAEPGAADYAAMSIKELKAALKDQGISYKGCLERADFVNRLMGKQEL